ncbi:hypothetical protein LGX01_07225 [Streptococcus mutans]|nr:hypothetical protein [Streptococcus mutans]
MSLLKEEILKEVQTFTKYYKRLLESQTLENFQKVTDEFEKQSLIMKSCDEFRTELTKYITQTTLRLVSEEKIVKKNQRTNETRRYLERRIWKYKISFCYLQKSTFSSKYLILSFTLLRIIYRYREYNAVV